MCARKNQNWISIIKLAGFQLSIAKHEAQLFTFPPSGLLPILTSQQPQDIFGDGGASGIGLFSWADEKPRGLPRFHGLYCTELPPSDLATPKNVLQVDTTSQLRMKPRSAATDGFIGTLKDFGYGQFIFQAVHPHWPDISQIPIDTPFSRFKKPMKSFPSWLTAFTHA